MPWVDSNTNDQRLRQMPNPHGFIWDEVHGVGGPPGWNANLYWPWEDCRILLTRVPSRMRSVPDRAVVFLYKPMPLPPPIVNPLGFRPVILRRIFSYCCGAAQANSCPVGERLVGACSHCVTALTLASVYPGHPNEFSSTHRGVRLVDRKNPQQMDIATVTEVS